jgi:hypothetical protein
VLKLSMVIVGLSALLLSAWDLRGAQEDYVRNSDFDQVDGDQPALWTATGAARPEKMSGGWQRMTVRFNSGENRQVSFFFVALKGSTGSVWIANLASPQVQIRNAGFGEVGPDGRPAGWNADNWGVAAFLDSTRGPAGGTSVRITHAAEAEQETRLWQTALPVEPHAEYTISYDVLVGDDFQGEAAAYIYDCPRHSVSLQTNLDELFVSNLVATRDRCGRYALALTPTAAAPAAVSQDVSVHARMNLYASADLNTKAFRGAARLSIADSVSGRVLGEASAKAAEAGWQEAQVSFQSVSPGLCIRVWAEGEGLVQVDNVRITPPRITPPLQEVRWLPATENFAIPAELRVSVRGLSGKVIEGGLELLAKDLEKRHLRLVRTDAAEASLRIIGAGAEATQGRGDESYALTVDSRGITLRAGAEAGVFYGLMTLLQLLEERDGKVLVLACDILDYPDLPMRGVLYGDPEQAARWKMNTLVVSDKIENFPELGRRYERWHLSVIPYFLTMDGGYYVEGVNPNLATGIWVKDEKVTLNGTAPSPLANPYVIRTGLTDVKLKSLDGTTEYAMGRDYRVIDGDMALWYDDPKARPFAVARLAGSLIPDGATVLASYDWVSHYRASDNRTEKHIPYVLPEPETQRLMSAALTKLAGGYPFRYIHTSVDIHEFFVADALLATDSRVIRSGKRPIELLAENALLLDKAAKAGHPGARIFQWTGSVGDDSRSAAPLLPKDAHINIWGYDAGWPAAYGREAVEYWSGLGFETSVMPWDNLRNVRGWAQVVAEARAKGYPCSGMIDACWTLGSTLRDGGMQETASVSWKIPRKGERGYVSLPEAKARTPTNGTQK